MSTLDATALLEDGRARTLVDVVAAQPTIEGGGIRVNRPFPVPGADSFDPFLLLDEMAPTVHEPGPSSGVPPHPHRGFETVTYMFEGELEHRDSAGNHGVIGPGDVQWMTAGDGIVHSEMTSERLQTEGGVSHGVQLWVNLPATLRRTTPRYQGLAREQMPTIDGSGWSVHLIAGDLFDHHGAADTHTSILYSVVTLDPRSELQIPVAQGHTALAYVIDGPIEVGDDRQPIGGQHMAVFDHLGGDIRLFNATDAVTRCLVLAGEPIGEPIARYGPFVMNTNAELHEAIDDFNAGRMGQLQATGGVTRIHQPDEDGEQ